MKLGNESMKTLIFFFLVSAIVLEAKPLPEKVVSIIQQSKYQHANWGILVRDVNTKEILYEKNSNQFFVPGSTTKIFTVAALLEAYGNDYRFKTPIYAMGSVQNGILKGNLILVGQGDLTLGGRQDPGSDEIAFTKFDHTYANQLPDSIWTEQDPLNGIRELAKGVKQKGIRRIDGDVLVDDRLFETIELRGLVLSPIMINENVIDLVICPTQEKEPVSITYRPMVDGYTIVNACQTVSASEPLQIEITSDASGKNIRLEGTVPIDQKDIHRAIPIKKPREFARAALIQALKEQDVEVNVAPNKGLPPVSAYTGLQPVAVLTSPPLSQYAKLILKVSHNLGADLVPLLLAAQKGGTTFNEGMLELGKFANKVAPGAFVFDDGAGGDYNRLTPRAEIQLFEYVRNWPKEKFQAFYNGLPILGVDGSLEDFGKDTSAVGKAYAKTGTVVGVNAATGLLFLYGQALAGYIKSKNGHLLEFMMAVSNADMPKIDDIFAIFEDQAQITAEFYNLSE
jgi:D-alanyl-D-alanine carboxypeptidase/D-alanyl-D-alanine-endopeptidase (penicillin-binding protein 4)